uniref:Putative secreted protein n=1 Tax=Ixodes ricinus TaxID=34613 RepID=A0A090XB00_IXORI
MAARHAHSNFPLSRSFVGLLSSLAFLPLKARSHLRLATAARLTSDVRRATTDPHTAGNLRVASRKLSGCPVDSIFPATPWFHVLLLSHFHCPTATGVP